MAARRPRWFVLTSLAAVMGLVLAACPEDEAIVDDETPDPTPVEGETPEPPDDELALTNACTNEEVGFTVDHPEGWVVNEENGLAPCSAFDPEDASLPEVGEIPTDIAIVIREERVEYDLVTDFAGDPGIEVIAEEETTVGGRTAVVAELEHTGDGLYPEGHVTYTYYVELEPFALVATTHGTEAADPPSFEERREILDAMMESLEFVEVTDADDDA